MKKLFLFISLFSTCALAQITPIQTNESPFDEIGRYVLYEKSTGHYILQVDSDNPYEDKVVRINIGKNAEEALSSLLNLLPTYNNKGATFEVQGYSFFVGDSRLYITANWLQYAAGDYYLPSGSLKDNIALLIDLKKLPLQEVHIEADNIKYGWFKVCYDTYGFTTTVLLTGTTMPKFSRQYKKGDKIESTDLLKLIPLIKDEKYFPFVRICEYVLNQ